MEDERQKSGPMPGLGVSVHESLCISTTWPLPRRRFKTLRQTSFKESITPVISILIIAPFCDLEVSKVFLFAAIHGDMTFTSMEA